ncbi:hypothetical protein [Microbacterium sp. GXF7504]
MTRTTPRRTLPGALRIAGVLLVASGLVVSGIQTAQAFTAITETGRAGLLQLAWGDTPQQIDDIGPGETHHWQIRASVSDADAETLDLTLRAEGALVTDDDGLRIALRRCDIPFTNLDGSPTCADGAETILSTTRVAEVASSTSGARWDLPPVTVDAPQYILATLSSPAGTPNATERRTASIGFGFTAQGADPAGETPGDTGGVASPVDGDDAGAQRLPSVLAVTGFDPLGPLLLALGLTGLGAAHLIVSRRMKQEQA